MDNQITLKQARNLRGLSRQSVADTLNVHVSTLINWENGKSSPPAKTFMQLCSIYGTSPDYIFLP